MKFGYTIVYVPDVAAAMRFYADAFGFGVRFLHESGDYGELETGATTLAFASHALGEANFPRGVVRASESERPLGVEIVFVTDDVDAACRAAVAQGGVVLTEPTQKPWGQTLAYVRAPDGTLIELCTPM